MNNEVTATDISKQTEIKDSQTSQTKEHEDEMGRMMKKQKDQ